MGQQLVEITQKVGSDGLSHTYNNIFSNAGNNQVLAGPTAPGQRIVVTAFVIQNESAVATTMILRSGGSVNGWRYLAQAQGDHLSKEFAPGHGWMLNINEPLVLNLSGANQCSCSVQYYYVTY